MFGHSPNNFAFAASGGRCTFVRLDLVLFLALRFRTHIGGALDDVRATIRNREFSMKAGPAGVELTAGARAATVLLQKEEARTTNGAATPEDVEAAVGSAVSVIAAESANPQRFVPRRILWVDDRRLAGERFDVVISDMGRPPDPRAGYTLLDELRRRGNPIPFVIYAGSRAREHIDEARRRGAVGTTNRPSELIELVAEALHPALRSGVYGQNP